MSLPGQFHWGGRAVREGRYKLEARSEGGKHGVVYRATDVKTSQPVAVKMLHGATPEALAGAARFIHEHPRVAPYLDFSEEDGQPYLVRRWLDGYFLIDEVRHNPLGAPRVLSLLAAIADGLAFLHAAGLVHGNLSWHNVFVGRPSSASALADEDVKVIDPALAGWSQGGVAADIAASVELARLMLDEEQVGPAPPALRALLERAPSLTAAELSSACQETLAALSAEEMNQVRVRKPPPPTPFPSHSGPPPPPPPAPPFPTNWSPPPPREPFVYSPATRPLTNPGPPPNLGEHVRPTNWSPPPVKAPLPIVPIAVGAALLVLLIALGYLLL